MYYKGRSFLAKENERFSLKKHEKQISKWKCVFLDDECHEITK